ncbi:neuropeptide-like protein 32 isoform X2 [Folsomia candida]|uniref:neuropeptide-like protein 32 isoform X2 n=1 Tax=Folsomia candida TaxID=158441 RepID=UPI000B906352|nr:neuropeptide-like protein 32 isoform X2 [Folsomia candida]
MNKVILAVFLVLCVVALSVSLPVEEQQQAAIPLVPHEAGDETDGGEIREKRQFFGGYGRRGFGRRGFGGYGRGYRGYGGYGGYGFYG